MLLSSLTAAALATARSRVVLRSNSIPASDADIQQMILSQMERPKSTPPVSLLNQSVIDENLDRLTAADRHESNHSMDSQNGVIINRTRQEILEDRHQQLLKKQRLLQQQYSKLQMLSRGQIPLPDNLLNDLKKTGSESNILSKTGLPPGLGSGSLTQLIPRQQSVVNGKGSVSPKKTTSGNSNQSGKQVQTQKIYETDIL